MGNLFCADKNLRPSLPPFWPASARAVGSRITALDEQADLALNEAWVTSPCVSFAAPAVMSTMVTEPSGSTVSSALGSPSLADDGHFPSGEDFTLSGNAPAISSLRKSPYASMKTILPGSWTGSAATATAGALS